MRYQTILKILEKLREVICHYLYDIYKIEPISTKNAQEYFIVDESEFTSLLNKPIWVIGIIYSLNKKFRIEIIEDRNSESIKSFIKRHISTGNIIVCDGWMGYNWLDSNQWGYVHRKHIHGAHDF